MTLVLIHRNALISVLRTGSKGNAHGNTMRYLVKLKWVEILVDAPTAAKRVYKVTNLGLEQLAPKLRYSWYPSAWAWWTPHVYHLNPSTEIEVMCPNPNCGRTQGIPVKRFYPFYGKNSHGDILLIGNATYRCPCCDIHWGSDVVMLYNSEYILAGIEKKLSERIATDDHV